jgi:L-methionine (R)-S-oxide reductase
MNTQSFEDRVAEVFASSSPRKDKACALAQLVRSARGFHWVGLYDVSQTHICAIAWTGASAPAFPIFTVTQGINGVAVAQGQRVVVQDISKDGRYLTTFGQTKAEAIFPVLSERGAVVGTIDVASDRVNAFGPEDETFLDRCTLLLAPLWGT